MKRPLAFALAFLIVALSPGAPAYQAFAQTVGRTGATGGTAGDAATSVNSGANGGLSAPLAIPTQSLGLNGALSLSAAPTLNAGINPSLGAPVAAAFTAPAALGGPRLAPAALDAKPVPTTVPAALLKPATTKGPASAASKQVQGLSETAKPVLEGIQKGDASLALKGVYEQSAKRGELGAVNAGSHAAALRSGLKRSAPSSAQKNLGEVVPAAASPAAKPGLWQRLKTTFDMTEFSKSEKAYIGGQAVFLLAISVYLSSLPLLVSALTGDAAMTGVARMVHFWVFGGVSLFAGAVVGRNPMKRILVGAAGGRAILFGTIGVLALLGALPWTGFLVLVGLNALLVAHNHLVDIDTGGAAKIFKGADQKATFQKIEKAGYIYDFIYYGMMLVVPVMIGLPMDWLSATLGDKISAGAGFALFAALMMVTSYIYAKHVVTIGDLAVKPLNGLKDWAKRMGGALAEFGRILVAVPKRNWATAKLIWGNKAILARSGMATMENFVEDALFAVVLPTFAFDILKAGSFGNGLMMAAITAGGLVSSLFLMKRVQALQQKHGTYKILAGLTILASLAFLPSIGLWAAPALVVASVFVLATGGGYAGLMRWIGGLQKSGARTDWIAARKTPVKIALTIVAVLAAVAAVPLIITSSVPPILAAIPAVFIMKLMLQPLRSRMRALLQTEIERDEKVAPHADDIYSLMTFTEVMAAGAGGLAFAWLFHNSLAGSALALTFGALAPMKIVTIVLVGMGLVYFGGLRWVKQQLSKPTRTVHKSPEGNEAKMLERLSVSLKENGLPDFKTATVSGAASEDLPTVVVLAPSSRHKIALAREGGRQSSDFHLVLDSSWLIQETYPDGTTKLLVKKGVVFDDQGQATVVDYETPRRVHYFANYFTLGANDRDDGDAFEKNLDIPQSNSLQLEKVVNDKLGTRLMLAAGGVAVPATLALLMPLHHLAGSSLGKQGTVQVAAMPAAEEREAVVGKMVDDYLRAFKGEELVVKPSGPQFHSGRGVKFFKKSERDAIVAHALALAVDGQMTEDGAVLLDERVNSAPLNRDGRKMETTGRILVARTPWGGAATTGMFARVGPWGKPTTAEAADPRDNAVVEPMEKLFAEWQRAGLIDAQGARELDAQMRKTGENALLAIAAYEKTLQRKDGEPYQAQSDMIGLDVMIEKRNGKLTPVIIEVNDHDSGGQYNLDQMHPEKSGEHSREWVATMNQRARRDALKGKRILLVGAGYEGKRPIFLRAKELGVKIVLAGPRSAFVDSLLKDGLVDEYIEADNTKVKEARDVIRKKLQRSARKNGKLDGITTAWEDDVELTALIAEDQKLPYHSAEASRTARSKFDTQEVLAKKDVPAARQQRIGNLSTAENEKEREAMIAAFRKSASAVGFPAVIKPVSGAAAIGTEKVSSLEEAVAAYKRISGIINPKTDPIFANNSDLLLMQYLDGHEYDVDLVMVAGKPVFQSLTDNKPTAEPSFLATGSRLPSILSAKQQKEAIDQAIASAQALGLTDGVIHMEGKYTSEGARLIEANARMGGTYVHEWVKSVWGVDLAEEMFMAAARIGGKPFMPAKPLVHLDGDFVNSDKAGVIKVLELPEEARKMPGFIRFRQVKKAGDRITTDEGGGYARVAMIEVGGKDAAEAKRNLDAIKAKVRFVVE